MENNNCTHYNTNHNDNENDIGKSDNTSNSGVKSKVDNGINFDIDSKIMKDKKVLEWVEGEASSDDCFSCTSCSDKEYNSDDDDDADVNIVDKNHRNMSNSKINNRNRNINSHKAFKKRHIIALDEGELKQELLKKIENYVKNMKI